MNVRINCMHACMLIIFFQHYLILCEVCDINLDYSNTFKKNVNKEFKAMYASM